MLLLLLVLSAVSASMAQRMLMLQQTQSADTAYQQAWQHAYMALQDAQLALQQRQTLGQLQALPSTQCGHTLWQGFCAANQPWQDTPDFISNHTAQWGQHTQRTWPHSNSTVPVYHIQTMLHTAEQQHFLITAVGFAPAPASTRVVLQSEMALP